MTDTTTLSPTDLACGVRGDAGFQLGLRLTHGELAAVRQHIERQWLDVIRNHAPQEVEIFAAQGIAHYHANADRLAHRSLWPKAARILPREAVTEIRTMGFMHALAEAFGDFTISDEEEIGREEIYWRLVRPGRPDDMGPLHADRWFWDLGHGTTPPGCDRVKVWVAVVTEPGLSGLRLVPGSHRREWRYHGEWRDGIMKPQFDEDEAALNPQIVPTAPGDVVVFHDALLHGGAPNRGSLTRVSFEFTAFIGGAISAGR